MLWKLELWEEEVSVDSCKMTNKLIEMVTTPTKTAKTNPIVGTATWWSRYQSIVSPLIVVCGCRNEDTVAMSTRTQRTRFHCYSLFCLSLVFFAIVLLCKYSSCHPMDYDTTISKSSWFGPEVGQTIRFLVQYHLKQCGCLQFEFILI